MQKRGGVDQGWYLEIRELTTPSSSSSNEEEEEKRSEEVNQDIPTSSGGSTAKNSSVAPEAPKEMATKREEGAAAAAAMPPPPPRPLGAEGNEARYDPMAWIILQLPSNLRPRGRKLLNESESSINWNVFSGEVSLASEKNRTLPGSNIVDIVRHALDPGRLEPTGYSQVYPYLPRGSTPPDDDSSSSGVSSTTASSDGDTTSTDGEDVMSSGETSVDTSSTESDDDDEWRDIDEVDAKAEKKLMKAVNRQ